MALFDNHTAWDDCYYSYEAKTLDELGFYGACEFRLERVDVPQIVDGVDARACELWNKPRNDRLYATAGIDGLADWGECEALERVGNTLVLECFPMSYALLAAAKDESSPLHKELDRRQSAFLRDYLHVLSVASYLKAGNHRYLTGVKAGRGFTGGLREFVPQGLLHNGSVGGNEDGVLDGEKDPFLENLLRELTEETGFVREDLCEMRLFGIDWSAQTGDFTPLYRLRLKSASERRIVKPRLSEEHTGFDFRTLRELEREDRYLQNPVSRQILEMMIEQRTGRFRKWLEQIEM